MVEEHRLPTRTVRQLGGHAICCFESCATVSTLPVVDDYSACGLVQFDVSAGFLYQHCLCSVSSLPPTDKRRTCDKQFGWAVYFPVVFLLAAQRALISSDSLLRPAGVSVPLFLAGAGFLPTAFLLAAQRAFISWESFLRPAGVSWPFLLAGVAVVAPPLILAQRALAAAESFARVPGEK
jgi:hypothetical protein